MSKKQIPEMLKTLKKKKIMMIMVISSVKTLIFWGGGGGSGVNSADKPYPVGEVTHTTC